MPVITPPDDGRTRTSGDSCSFVLSGKEGGNLPRPFEASYDESLFARNWHPRTACLTVTANCKLREDRRNRG